MNLDVVAQNVFKFITLIVIPYENWRQLPLSVPGFHFSKPSAYDEN